jgi:23S rRNA (cytosine1962-C5)-methyltransferase
MPDQVILKRGRERSALNRHPWIFEGAIARVEGEPRDGAAVEVRGSDGAWLARGTWSGQSQIRVRLWTWDEAEAIDSRLIESRVRRALDGRRALMNDSRTTAYRLIFAESDGLPGVVADRYGDWVVLQLSTVGAAVRAQPIVEALADQLRPRGIYERSDAEMRTREGLTPSDRLLWGDPPDGPLEILENGYRYLVDFVSGHKTGAYLDQRLNRQRVAAYCVGEILSCFSYTGGFEIAAAAAGATQITAIDSSADALAVAVHNLGLNGIDAPVEHIEGNVFSELRRFRAEGRTFDAIILDPPKFVHHRGQIERASRGYKDINLLAMQLLRPGGILATFSCSGLVSADLFQKIVWGAAVDARRDVQILERLTQAPDHPVLLTFPESEYLKGLICRVH